MKRVEALKSSALWRSLNILSSKDRKKLSAIVLLQVFFGFLDLLGVALIGLLGALTINGVQSKSPGTRVSQVLEFLNLEKFSFQHQVAVIGLIAAVLLIGKTFLSMYFGKLVLRFLSFRSAQISSDLVKKLLSTPLLQVQMNTSQQTIYALTTGVTTVTIGIIGAFVSIISDTALLLILSIGLFVVDPIMSISIFLVFSVVAILLYYLLHKKAKRLGEQEAQLNIASFEKINEVLLSYRETTVRGRRSNYANEISNIRYELSNTVAELGFLPNISKYIVETVVVIGALLISAVQFSLNDASQAIASLSIFLAAGSRIAPAVLRVQQSSISIKGNAGIAGPTLDLSKKLEQVIIKDVEESKIDFQHIGFVPKISIKHLDFSYPGSKIKSLQDIDLEINAGESLAIVGPSGAGKTTLIDILLGVHDYMFGSVEISGKKPEAAILAWPGAISYVPQDVHVVNGSVRKNVSLGYPTLSDEHELIRTALELAQLGEFLESVSGNIDHYVGERGTRLSGGQRQRLGIARALFTNPKLLVLDEATSALDGKTEMDISAALKNLSGKTTVIMIAHRLSSVKAVNKVAYMENGKILALGTFQEVRDKIPNFDDQAKLMGL
jgi:ABC-type multidrug transport system fused ATPase/permease subunit